MVGLSQFTLKGGYVRNYDHRPGLCEDVFHAQGHVMFRKKLRRNKLHDFFGRLAPCVVAMEACGGAHHWAREIGKPGQYVQATAMVFRVRELFIRKRTQLINALRGYFTEFPFIAPFDAMNAMKLIAAVEDEASVLPQAARQVLKDLIGSLSDLEARIVWALMAKGGVYQSPVATP